MLTAALARYLADHGHGTYATSGASITLEELPAEPKSATAVAFKPAPPDATVDGWSREAVQIIVRRPPGNIGRARSGYQAARAIRDLLNGLTGVTLAASTPDEVRLVWLRSDDAGPTNLGDDTTGTPRWSLRFVALTGHDTPHTTL